MASLRTALLLSCAVALFLSAQARPLEEVSPLGQLGVRHLLANASEPCCSLYKKTSADLAGFSAQAKSLASQQGNLITSLLTQPSIKQSMLDFLAQVGWLVNDNMLGLSLNLKIGLACCLPTAPKLHCSSG